MPPQRACHQCRCCLLLQQRRSLRRPQLQRWEAPASALGPCRALEKVEQGLHVAQGKQNRYITVTLRVPKPSWHFCGATYKSHGELCNTLHARIQAANL